MKAQLISSVLLLSAGSAVAAERAVEAVHYEADIDGRYYDTDLGGSYTPGSSQILLLGLRSAITVPVGESFGASLTGSYAASTGDSVSGSNAIDSDTKELYGAASVFYRNPDFGRIGFSYLRQSTDFSYSINGGPSVSRTDSFYGYSGLIEAYLGSFTLGVSDSRSYAETNLPLDNRDDSIFATADWYVTTNVRVGAQMGFVESEGTYGASVEFQPAFLRNMGGFYAQYNYTDRDDAKTNSVGIGFRFYFDKRFDLVTRDRHYR